MFGGMPILVEHVRFALVAPQRRRGLPVRVDQTGELLPHSEALRGTQGDGETERDNLVELEVRESLETVRNPAGTSRT